MKLLKVYYVINSKKQRAIARKNLIEYPERLLWLKKTKKHILKYKEKIK